MSSSKSPRRASHAKGIQRDEILQFLEKCEESNTKPYAYDYADAETIGTNAMEDAADLGDSTMEAKNASEPSNADKPVANAAPVPSPLDETVQLPVLSIPEIFPALSVETITDEPNASEVGAAPASPMRVEADIQAEIEQAAENGPEPDATAELEALVEPGATAELDAVAEPDETAELGDLAEPEETVELDVPTESDEQSSEPTQSEAAEEKTDEAPSNTSEEPAEDDAATAEASPESVDTAAETTVTAAVEAAAAAKPAEAPAESDEQADAAKAKSTAEQNAGSNVADDTQAEDEEPREVVIEFRNVTKKYKLFKNERGRFLDLFNLEKRGSLVAVTNACNDLSFQIRRGEAVALIGRNGAGKSTTLKMITGVVFPTSGEVIVNGRVSALLELPAGFDYKLTGRENITLRGQIMGLTNEEIAELEPSIVEFAELGDYIDQPLRTYSSGMKSRLGFAFAVSVNPEILVVDEALSVGDRAFQKKCIDRIREIMEDKNVTVLFVTHASATAKEFCKRGLVLDHGNLMFDGEISEATKYYNEHYLDRDQGTVDLPEVDEMESFHDYVTSSTNLLLDTDVKGLAKKDAPHDRAHSVANGNFAASWYNFAEKGTEPPEEGLENAFEWKVNAAAGVVYKAYYFYSNASLELLEGNQYTIGCWVYCSEEGATTAALQIYAPQGSYPASKDLGLKFFRLAPGWQYIAHTFKCTQTRTNYRAYFGCQAKGRDGIQRMCGFALVEGTPA